MRKSIFTLCLLGLFALCTTNTSQAQIHFGFDVSGGFPLNEFQAQNPNTGVGINLNAFFPFAPQVPVYIGLDLGFMGNGSRTNTITENLILRDGLGNTIVNFPILFDVQTRNNIFNGHVILRTKIPLPLVQPYFEGLVGFKSFSTRVSLTDVRAGDGIGNNIFNINYDQLRQNSQVNTTVLSSTALSYGFGAGFHIMFGGGQFGLNLGARYLLGGTAQYYTREDINEWTATFDTSSLTTNPDNAQAQLNNGGNPRNSRTDMLVANIGIVIKL
ncbi:hypothetical protein [uncultured Microscilla sp.]|uniref:hypothetical protein n=1 Tax=uncultured Microscilla sp. TaxID=432653 RepID=UPI00262C884F|nr:hypothetical protein [uncultured Microscilla sp.]